MFSRHSEDRKNISRSMGLNVSSGDIYVTNPDVPSPYEYQIMRHFPIGKYLIVEVKYDCKHYEGRKILIFENLTIPELLEYNSLDPHFYPESKLFARLKPTKDGWDKAIKMIRTLEEN